MILNWRDGNRLSESGDISIILTQVLPRLPSPRIRTGRTGASVRFFYSIWSVLPKRRISGDFTADVLARNTPMMKVFAKTGYPLKTHLESGVYELEISFGG